MIDVYFFYVTDYAEGYFISIDVACGLHLRAKHRSAVVEQIIGKQAKHKIKKVKFAESPYRLTESQRKKHRVWLRIKIVKKQAGYKL